MSSQEIRLKFLDFFKARGHAIVPSASLVPENDPTTLFTGSGMQPMVPYLLGAKHPLGRRIADSQKSFRAEDIEEVGDNRHTTFFEMLGNWSFGNPDAADRVGVGYWKKEQLSWLFEFLTKEIGIPRDRLWVTCFAGDEKLNLPPDNESAEIWKSLGISEEKIKFYGSHKNWWSRAGEPENMPAGEPGGPDSEIFYEFTQVKHDKKFGENCHPNCDCGRFLEIGNSVFMEYKKRQDGTFEKLKQRNVDFGGGLERITAAANDDPDVFNIDVFRQTMKHLPETFPLAKRRVIADHGRAMAFLIADGVRPSNKGAGYVLRRIMRRAMVYGYLTGDPNLNLHFVIRDTISEYRDVYPELRAETIIPVYDEENSRFLSTFQNGLREFHKISASGKVSGKDTFMLFTSYGLPPEITFEFAKEKGIDVDKGEFNVEFEKHRELSRTASAGVFRGGLADHSEKTTRLHTAHHLLLRALQIVLGPQVKQRGSNITSERLRLDFLYSEKMSDEQKKEAERIVNEKIAEDLPVVRSEMAREDAEKLGAEHEFGQKYPERVSVYSIGPKDATQEGPKFEQVFSIEFCGGPHVTRTGEIGRFRITKEEAVGAGIRRVRGALD